jgi:hypothetical protein
VDDDGNVYISDQTNYRVLYWKNGASSGVMIAGNGMRNYTIHFIILYSYR